MSKSLYKNAFSKLVLNLFNIVVPLLIGPYVARTLGPEKLGSVNYINSIYSYFYIFASFGVYQYGIREVSRVRNNSEKVSDIFTNLFSFTMITNIIVFFIFIIFSLNFKNNDTILYNISILMSFNFLSNIFYIEWANEGFENYQFISTKSIIVRLIYLVLLITFVKNSNDIYIYIILLSFSTFANNIISFIFIKRNIKFNFKNINFFKNIKPMFMVVILSNSNMLYTQLDKIIIGSKNKLGVAYYCMAQNIMTIINTLMLTLIDVAIPRLTNHSENNNKEYIRLLNKISSIYFLIVYPIGIGIFILAKEIILIYGGYEYIESANILKIFSIYMITLGYEGILGNQILYIKGKERIQVILIFVCGIINLLLNILLVKLNFATGAMLIFTTTISNILLIFMQYLYIRKVLEIKLDIFNLSIFKYLIISLTFIPINYLIELIVHNFIFSIILIILICSIYYFTILYLIKDKIFIEIIENCTKYIKKLRYRS